MVFVRQPNTFNLVARTTKSQLELGDIIFKVKNVDKMEKFAIAKKHCHKIKLYP